MKQRNIAFTAKVRKYQERVDRFRQDRMFRNNQRQFYRILNQEGERCDYDQPNAKESTTFLGNIWREMIERLTE